MRKVLDLCRFFYIFENFENGWQYKSVLKIDFELENLAEKRDSVWLKPVNYA